MRNPGRNELKALFLALALSAGAYCAGQVTIVSNPGRFGSAEAAANAETQINWWNADAVADANACTESFAAVELRNFLSRAMQMPADGIRLADARELPAAGNVILIGSGSSNPLISSLPGNPAGVGEAMAAESFRISAFRQGGRTITVILGGDRVGALYGVYAYLERLGVRFYGLGDRDTVLPSAPARLPTDLSVSEKPDYLTRGFFAWEDRGNTPFFLWMARNRLNLWSALGSREKACLLKKLGMKLMAADHDLQSICLNPHVYFAKHPEWYGLHDGKRSPNIPPHGRGDNYCTSNAGATAQLAENVVRECIDGQWRYADVLNLWMTDFGRWCECDNCKKEGSYSDRLMDVTYAVRKALKKAQADGRLKRNVQVATLAYHETLPPPDHPLPADFDYANCSVTYFPIERCYVHGLADPSCSEVNEPLCRDLEGWTVGKGRYYTGSIFIGEYYDISSFKTLPLLFTRMMAIDIPWYYKIGARHFHYMHVPLRLWGTWRLNNYLMGRLLWDVHADSDRILGEYFAAFYPEAREPMQSFYGELEYASENFKAFKNFIYADGKRYALRSALLDDKLPLFPTKHLTYDGPPAAVNSGPSVVEIEAAMGRARLDIDSALLLATDPTERARIAEDERRFAYGEATVDFYYRMVRTALFHRSGDVVQATREFELAERQAVILKHVVDLVNVSFTHANAKDGLEATQAEDAFERFRKLFDPTGAHFQ